MKKIIRTKNDTKKHLPVRQTGKKNDIRSQAEINAVILKKVQLHTKKLLTTMPYGRYKSLFKSSGLEYHSSREYAFSDDSRHIDWNVSSRLQTLHTKSFLEEREHNLWCVCDVSSSMDIGAPQSLRNLAAEVSTTFLLLAYLCGDKVGGLVFSNDIHKVFKAKKSLDIVFKFLSECTVERKKNNQSNLYDALLYVYRVLSQRTLIVVVSDFLNDKVEEALTLVSRVHDVLVIRVMYDVLAMMPNYGVMKIRDCESNSKAFITFKRARQEYNVINENQQKKWDLFCRVKRIRKIDIKSGQSVFDVLYKKMRWHNKLV